MDSRNVLGKGLSALIPEAAEPKEKVQNLPLERIHASALQPRKKFADAALQELAQSIKEKGIIQPVLVRPTETGYELVAGERRFRAAQSLGWTEIPAIVRKVADGDLLEISLIENIQREELSKIEEARAYERLSKDFGLSHELISQRVSKDRSTITNTLRLLELPEKIQKFLEENTITMGHARSLLPLGDEKAQLKVCERIVRQGLSVRQSENLVRNEASGRKIFRFKGKRDVHVMAMEEQLQHRLGTRVRILQGKKRGKIVIDFFSTEDLTRVLDILAAPGQPPVQ